GSIAEELLPAFLPEFVVGIVGGREAESRLVFDAHDAGAGIVWRNERIVALASDPEDLIEALAVALADVAGQREVGDRGGAAPLIPEPVGQDALFGMEGRPAARGVGEPVGAAPPAPARRESREVLGVVVVEHDALGREAVEVRSLDPAVAVTPQEA